MQLPHLHSQNKSPICEGRRSEGGRDPREIISLRSPLELTARQAVGEGWEDNEGG